MIAWWRKRHQPEPTDPMPDRGEPVEQMLRRLDWTVSRPIARRLGGDATSIARGSGLDLAEIREYQPGDDVRHLDWNATARTGRPHIRQTFTERALDAAGGPARRVAARHGFAAEGHAVEIFGRCAACRGARRGGAVTTAQSHIQEGRARWPRP